MCVCVCVCVCVERGGIVKILVGENATKLAAKVLSNIAEGRGGTLPLDTVCLASLIFV